MQMTSCFLSTMQSSIFSLRHNRSLKKYGPKEQNLPSKTYVIVYQENVWIHSCVYFAFQICNLQQFSSLRFWASKDEHFQCTTCAVDILSFCFVLLMAETCSQFLQNSIKKKHLGSSLTILLDFDGIGRQKYALTPWFSQVIIFNKQYKFL